MRLIDADALYNKYQEAMTHLLSSTNIENISAEAISLLCGSVLIKEAPTVNKARLLTLREAEEADCVWIEVMPHTMIGVRHIELVPVDTTACMVYTFGGSPSCYNTCDYGTRWRCWSAKPDIGQMREVEWDEN